MDIMAGFSASNRSRTNPQELSNCSWNLVYRWLFFWVKNLHAPSFEPSGYSTTTNGAMDKCRPPLDSTHQIGLDGPWLAFLIVGWGCLIDAWKYRPEFFCLECLCLLLHNQGSCGRMDGTVGFSASNESRSNRPRLSNCRLEMLYKVVNKLGAEFRNLERFCL